MMPYPVEDIVGDDRWLKLWDDPEKLEAAESNLFDRSIEDYPEKKRSFDALDEKGQAGVRDDFSGFMRKRFPDRFPARDKPDEHVEHQQPAVGNPNWLEQAFVSTARGGLHTAKFVADVGARVASGELVVEDLAKLGTSLGVVGLDVLERVGQREDKRVGAETPGPLTLWAREGKRQARENATILDNLVQQSNPVAKVFEDASQEVDETLDVVHKAYPTRRFAERTADGKKVIHWELLKSGEYWAQTLPEFVQQLAASVALSGGTIKGTAIMGGAMEAVPALEQLEASDDPDAELRAATFGIVVAALEKIGLDRMFGGGNASRLKRAAAGFIAEPSTEWAEEPVAAFLNYMGREGYTAKDVTREVLQAAWDGIEVIPATALIGLVGGASGSRMSSQQRDALVTQVSDALPGLQAAREAFVPDQAGLEPRSPATVPGAAAETAGKPSAPRVPTTETIPPEPTAAQEPSRADVWAELSGAMGFPMRAGKIMNLQHGRSSKPYQVRIVDVVDGETVRIEPAGSQANRNRLKKNNVPHNVSTSGLTERMQEEKLRARSQVLSKLTKDERREVRAASKEFDEMIEQETFFFPGEAQDEIATYPSQRQAGMAHSRWKKVARQEAFKALGIDADPDNPVERSKALPKLKEWLAGEGKGVIASDTGKQRIREIKKAGEQPVMEFDLNDQALVYREDEWYRVEKDAGRGVRLIDGETIQLDDFDTVDVSGAIEPGEPGYEEALGQYKEQVREEGGEEYLREVRARQDLEGRSAEEIDPAVVEAEGEEYLREVRARQDLEGRSAEDIDPAVVEAEGEEYLREVRARQDLEGRSAEPVDIEDIVARGDSEALSGVLGRKATFREDGRIAIRGLPPAEAGPMVERLREMGIETDSKRATKSGKVNIIASAVFDMPEEAPAAPPPRTAAEEPPRNALAAEIQNNLRLLEEQDPADPTERTIVRQMAKDSRAILSQIQGGAEPTPGQVQELAERWDKLKEVFARLRAQFAAKSGAAQAPVQESFLPEDQDLFSISSEIAELSERAGDLFRDDLTTLTSGGVDKKWTKKIEDELVVPGPGEGEKPTPKFASPKVEAKWQSAKLAPVPARKKLIKALDGVIKSFRRKFILLDPVRDAAVIDVLRRFEAVPHTSEAYAMEILKGITEGFGPKKYDLLKRAVFLPDILRDVERGLYNGRPLPFEYKDAVEMQEDWNRIQEWIEANPAVAEALAARVKIWDAVRGELVANDLLPRSVLDNPHYFHHQVLAKMELELTMRRSKDVRTHTKTWQRARTGSPDLYNTDFIEPEYEVLKEAFEQLETLNTLRQLKELADVRPTLEQAAKIGNLHAAYGGKEMYEKAMQLRAEIRQMREEGDPGDSYIQQQLAIMHEKLDQIDPLWPFVVQKAVAKSMVGQVLKRGDVPPDEIPERYRDAATALMSQSKKLKNQPDLDMDLSAMDIPEYESRHFWGLMNWLGNRPGKEAAPARMFFKAMAEEKAEIQKRAGDDFRTWQQLMTDEYRPWQPKKGSHFFKVFTVQERILQQVSEGTKKLTEGDVEEHLAMGQPKEQWVIPKRLADTLDNFQPPAEEHGPARLAKKITKSWKVWTLFNPLNTVRHYINNFSGDLDIVLAFHPTILKHAPKAWVDMKHYVGRRGRASEDILEMLRLGVIDSGFAQEELPDLKKHEVFRTITGATPNVIEWYWENIRGYHVWRENTLRVAAYRYFLERERAGVRDIGASRRTEMIQMRRANMGPKVIAAKLAREMIGDYGAISHAGRFLRDRMMPFYSWIEINTPRYLRGLANTRYDSATGERAGRGKQAYQAARFAAFASMLYAIVKIINQTRYPEEDKIINRSRNQLHLILGRDEETGDILSIRFQGALSDALSWIDMEDPTARIEEGMTGQKSIGEIFRDVGKAPFNRLVNSSYPIQKTAFESVSHRSFHPDLWEPRRVRDPWNHLASGFSLDEVYRVAMDRPGSSLGSEILGVVAYKTDIGQASYFKSMDIIREWNTAHNRQSGIADTTPKGNALYYHKRAMRLKEYRRAENYLVQYLDMGGTMNGLEQSLAMGRPLRSVGKDYFLPFWSSLTPEKQDILRAGISWYEFNYLRTDRSAAATQVYLNALKRSETGGRVNPALIKSIRKMAPDG